ncbi:MAG TPA: ATP-binding protein [Candidatus Acidoferrales bacterium]|nr:ATP-binding protein [Candidatus Acidoferrales bacterium]
MPKRRWTRHLWLAFGGICIAVLAAAIFTLGSLNAPVRPQNSHDFIILFSLSTFIVIAFLVFGLILIRSVVRLAAEHRAGILGSRFKTKMVLGAMGVSLLPVVFLFFFSYALVNRTMAIWFPKPLEDANQQSRALVNEMGAKERVRLDSLANDVVAWLSAPRRHRDLRHYATRSDSEFDAVWTVNESGAITAAVPAFTVGANPRHVLQLPSGADVWQIGRKLYLTGRAPYHSGSLMVGRTIPDDFLDRLNSIEGENKTYQTQYQHLRFYKNEILAGLLLITLLLLFATTWVALFLSKHVTVPIQALAKATQQIARGNLDYRITTRAYDELGDLVSSFNQMARELGHSRKQIDDFTSSLQQAVEEIERRRKLMETILENIPTGVLSLDENGAINRINAAALSMFGPQAAGARTLSDLLGEDAARQVLHLMRRSARMGVASQELEISSTGRLHHAAVTVSSLGSGRAHSGYVVVIDDVTELLRAQKAAAWQEVAQRIAHEIKNPLTPIQLSAQRLLRHLERSSPSRRRDDRANSLPDLVAECANLIQREVRTLESLVNEFSQFARFPAARLAPADVNSITAEALAVFHGRLEGIALHREFSASLPAVKADAELIRRVIVNLVDNAAEALEGAQLRRITVATRAINNREAVEIEVADTGHGISPEDKDRLFLPHFSTKERGTGLGLAIASRVIAEHHGTLRVEDNVPSGARFLILLPAAAALPAEVSAAHPILEPGDNS